MQWYMPRLDSYGMVALLGGLSLLAANTPAQAQGFGLGWPGDSSFPEFQNYPDDVDLNVARVEITQGIQVFDPTADLPTNNSLPLIGNRSTLLRVYIDTGPTTRSIPYVTGKIDVYRNGTLTNTWGAEFPGWITAHETAPRSLEKSTLNFELPNDLQGGNIDILITLDFIDFVPELNENNNTFLLNGLEFLCIEAPEIVYTPINYTAAAEPDTSTLGMPDPSLIGPGFGAAMVWAIYPFPDTRGSYHLGSFPPIEFSEDIDNASDELLSQLELTRVMMSPSPDYIYGWFRGNPYAHNGRALSIPSNAVFGNTDPARSQRTFGHELGHAFGYMHNTNTLAPEIGVDVQYALALERMKATGMADIMWPALNTDQAWITPASYLPIIESGAFSCNGNNDGWGFHFSVGGQTDANGAAQFYPIWRVGGVRPITPLRPIQNQADERVLFVLDKDGNLIYANSTLAHFHGDSDGNEPYAAVAWVVPELPQAHTFELRGPGGVHLLDQIQRSENVPVVDLVEPEEGGQIGGQLHVKWVASDADGDPLRYSLRYSPDGGASYVPLAVDLSVEEAFVDTAGLAKSLGTGVIELIASDGLNCTYARVFELTLNNDNAPALELILPKPGSVVTAGSPLRMQAASYDAEDGRLSSQSLLWSSSLDGPLGSGESLMLSDLKVGIHQIAVHATDSDGKVSSTSVTVRIQKSIF